MRNMLLLMMTGMGLLALSAAPVWAQSTQGREMSVKVTTAVKMTGMNMPPRTLTDKVCMAAQHKDLRNMIRKGMNGRCELTDYKVAGSTVTYRIACAKPEKVEGTGTFHWSSNGGFNGTQHMTVQAAGRTIATSSTYAGTPTGASCTYQPPKH